MAKVIQTAKFLIPTPKELRNHLKENGHLSALDICDIYFQFEMDEESSTLYTF